MGETLHKAMITYRMQRAILTQELNHASGRVRLCEQALMEAENREQHFASLGTPTGTWPVALEEASATCVAAQRVLQQAQGEVRGIERRLEALGSMAP